MATHFWMKKNIPLLSQKMVDNFTCSGFKSKMVHKFNMARLCRLLATQVAQHNWIQSFSLTVFLYIPSIFIGFD